MIYKETELTPEILETLEDNQPYLCIVESPDDETPLECELEQAQLWIKFKKDKQHFEDMRFYFRKN